MARRRPATQGPAPSAPSQRGFLRTELWGLLLLACAVVYNAYYVEPELRISRVPFNDVVFHLVASQRLEASFARGEPFLDPWVSEWALGYPLWRSYQPLPHAVSALLLWVFHRVADPAAIFAAILYFLLVTFPVSVYLGARLLGLSPPAAGLSALLVYGASADGYLGRYGLGYGAYVWRGSGLFTQLFALHLLIITLGMASRALDLGGRGRQAGTSLMLALTSLSHIVFGYTAFVSAALLAVAGPRDQRSQRLLRLAKIAISAIVLFAWFLIPLFLSRGIVNHSRWEDPQKWNSYGAAFILGELFSGRMFDLNRLPWLSGLMVLGLVGAIIAYRKPLAQRLMGLTALWLLLFFGRATWGRLVLLVGVPADMPMHRFQAMFELSSILLASYGICELAARLAKWKRNAAVALGIMVGMAVVAIAVDRAGYLEENKRVGYANLAAYERERPDLEKALNDVREVLAERPGRVSAGPAQTWGKHFRIGLAPVYTFLSLEHFDQASFLYHSMSKTADIMGMLHPSSRGWDMAMGIRAIVAPVNRPMPPFLKTRAVHGRFAVYESSPEGYFGVVEIGGHYVGPASTDYEPSAAWLDSALETQGIVISLDPRAQIGPAIKRWDPLPAPEQMDLHGQILSETKIDETYQARIEVNRPAYAFVKFTWTPDWRATVDGKAAPVIHVTPGFCAVPIPAGQHDVVLRYKPTRLKPFLLVIGVILWGSFWLWPFKQ